MIDVHETNLHRSFSFRLAPFAVVVIAFCVYAATCYRTIHFVNDISLNGMEWLEPYLRLEGITRQLIPIRNPSPNMELLRENLFHKIGLRGMADSDCELDAVTVNNGRNLYQGFMALADDVKQHGDQAGCEEIRKIILERLPPERLGLPSEWIEHIDNMCDETE